MQIYNILKIKQCQKYIFLSFYSILKRKNSRSTVGQQMQSSWNRKKSFTQLNDLLHQIHFCVCPYLVQLSQKLESMFTLNFQKDYQIVGQLSTMIYQEGDQMKIQIQPIQNIIFFRIFHNKKSQYKWSLYQRKTNGKQQFVQSINAKLQQAIQQFIQQQKKYHQTITKSKSYQSKALSNSSKINQSNIRSTQKSLSIRKSTISFTNDINLFKSKFIKTLKGNFNRTGLGLNYLICMGNSQQEIKDTVREFYLEEKLNLIGRSLGGEIDDMKYKKTKSIQVPEGLQKIDQELEISHRSMKTARSGKSAKSVEIQANKQSRILQEETVKQNLFQKLLKVGQNNNKTLKNSEIEQKLSKIQQTEELINEQNHQERSQNKLQVQQSKRQQLNYSQQRNYDKQMQTLHPDYLTNMKKSKNKLPNLQLKQDLYKTQKSILQKPSHLILSSHDPQLIQTTPTILKTRQQLSNHLLNTSKNIQPDSSYLKLDDVILLGKRVSYSDKSQWMKTSKSRTNMQEQHGSNDNKTIDIESKKNMNHQSRSNQNQMQQNDQQSLKFRMEIQSRKDDDMQFLDIVSLRPRQYEGDQQENQLTKTQKMKQFDNLHENQNKTGFKVNHLKRKSTVQQVIRKDNFEFGFKPKTMGDKEIKKSMKEIKQMQKINSNSRSNSERQDTQIKLSGTRKEASVSEQSNEQQNQINIHISNVGLNRKQTKLTINMPSIIIQQTETMTTTPKDDRINNCKNTDKNHNKSDDNQEQLFQQQWGRGLSQIKTESIIIDQNNTNNKLQTIKHQINQKLQNKLQYLKQTFYKPYIQPYFQAIINKASSYKQKLQTNQTLKTIKQRCFHNDNQQKRKVNFKYVLLALIVIILMVVVVNSGAFLDGENKLDRNDDIFKKKKAKKIKYKVKNKSK